MRSSNAELAHHLRQRQGLLAQRLGCGQGLFHQGCVLLCALVHLRDGLVDLGGLGDLTGPGGLSGLAGLAGLAVAWDREWGVPDSLRLAAACGAANAETPYPARFRSDRVQDLFQTCRADPLG